jgi:hypothetical protein
MLFSGAGGFGERWLSDWLTVFNAKLMLLPYIVSFVGHMNIRRPSLHFQSLVSLDTCASWWT